MPKDYGSWNLAALKDELKRRNAKITGKKAALVQRLMDYDTLFGQLVNNPEAVTYRIAVPSAENFWDVNSDSTMPHIEEAQLLQYSVLTDRGNLQTSKNMYNELYLQTCRVAHCDNTFYFVALCSSEMRKNITYSVTITVQSNMIMEGQCECAAGIGPYAQCKHVFVLIYGLMDFTCNKIIKTKASCTSTLQKFHQPSRKHTGDPVKAEELKLKIKDIQKITEFDPRLDNSDKENYVPYFKNIVINFCAQQKVSMPMLQLTKPADKRALFRDHDYLKDTEEKKFLLSLKLSDTQRSELEKATVSNKKLWLQERTKRLQSSNFGSICKCSAEKAPKLAKSYLFSEEIKSSAITHGLKYEPKAINIFEKETGLKVTKCGIVTHKDLYYLACTPDGIIDSENALIEVKCPFSAQNRPATPENVPYIYLCAKTGHYALDKNHNYYYQVQGQLMCTGRQYAYFIVYTITDFCIIKVGRDEYFMNNMLKKLNDFYLIFEKYLLNLRYLYNVKF